MRFLKKGKDEMPTSGNKDLEAAILEALCNVKDPDLHRDIVSLGFVKDLRICGGQVAFTIELTTPACPAKEMLQQQARHFVEAIPGVEEVSIKMTSQVRPLRIEKPEGMGKSLLPGVKNILPIASGKGGVGKSTVSANIALALSHMGAKVGLMDADIYGPSIPRIMGVEHGPKRDDHSGKIIPANQHDIKIISAGFFMRPDDAAILRGPMLHKNLQLFLEGVEWGELDYLIIDLPPGTGDVQLSLCQLVPLTGSAIVSTPQDVALSVAQKAIAMFVKLNCPILGFIENMSYFICRHCGQREDIFNSGGVKKACERLQIPFLGEIPLATELRTASDEGKPMVVSDPNSPISQAFFTVASNLAAQISIQNMTTPEPSIIIRRE